MTALHRVAESGRFRVVLIFGLTSKKLIHKYLKNKYSNMLEWKDFHIERLLQKIEHALVNCKFIDLFSRIITET